MPLYEYRCQVCGHITSKLRSINDRRNLCLCQKCSSVAELAVSILSAITDKRFPLTGKYDDRLGTHVKGRKHFHQECKNRGFAEISKYDMPKHETFEERLTKQNKLITKETLMK